MSTIYLVLLGGAGACLPCLLVVLRICTFPLPWLENVDNFVDVEPVSRKDKWNKMSQNKTKTTK